MNKRPLFSALLLVLISTFAFVSCKKDMNSDTITPTPDVPFAIPAASPVSGSLTGLVVDEHNTPVTGAVVTFGSTTVASDARGMFSFNHVTLDKYISTVTVSKTGYFKAFRSFSATASRNFVDIKLLPKTLSGTVSSSAAGSVNLANGTEIAFQSNSIVVKATGASYTGSVKVFASYIDPTSTDISSVVPGSFMGRDANNLYALQSTGMIAVDLESPAGEALQLKTGLPANIKLPIPASLLSKAPATIDTWSLNDQGVWQKEGSATKNGDHYEMTVTHFSFWNCDVPANAIYLSLHVQDQNGSPLSHLVVSLTQPNNTTWWATAYGVTDSAGNVSGLVPSGVALTMNTYPNTYTCYNSPTSTQVIGPFAGNTSLTVTVTLSTSQTVTVSGTATDCSNQPLATGTAIVYTGLYGYQYVPIVNGNYTSTFIQCGTAGTVEVTAIDNSTGAQANSGTITVTGNTVTVPVLNACGGATTAVFTFGNAGQCAVTYNGYYQVGIPLSGTNIVAIQVSVTTPGTYAITTNSANGITFSATGVFTSTGIQNVYLAGSGTPTVSGFATFQAQSGTVTGCGFNIQISPAPVPPAVYSLGGPGACNGVTVAGSYNVGLPLLGPNTASFTVDVTTPGSYSISTGNPVNGMMFADSGVFSTIGPRIVVLYASGVPTNAGTSTFTPASTIAGSGGTGCTFNVTTNNSNGNAVFTFGSGGSCPTPTVAGTYTAGTALNNTNTVTLTVNVTTPGNYSITTGTANATSFNGTGTLTATGTQQIVLTGTGTATQTGVYTYIPYFNNNQGCPFTITFN